jgi:pilus assembly protein FimV
MPKHDIETQSMDDEVDTKLNLAKASIELGDAAGARTILNEVVAEGTATQQEEAQKLLQDMD